MERELKAAKSTIASLRARDDKDSDTIVLRPSVVTRGYSLANIRRSGERRPCRSSSITSSEIGQSRDFDSPNLDRMGVGFRGPDPVGAASTVGAFGGRFKFPRYF